MKVIITQQFEQHYIKKFSKYFTIQEFIHSIKNKQHSHIALHFPYFKIKARMRMVSFRGIIAIINNNAIIPLIIEMKKDKKIGENLTWHQSENKIIAEYDKAIDDIEKGSYQIF